MPLNRSEKTAALIVAAALCWGLFVAAAMWLVR